MSLLAIHFVCDPCDARQGQLSGAGEWGGGGGGLECADRPSDAQHGVRHLRSSLIIDEGPIFAMIPVSCFFYAVGCSISS